jgi:hypothetical protein
VPLHWYSPQVTRKLLLYNAFLLHQNYGVPDRDSVSSRDLRFAVQLLPDGAVVPAEQTAEPGLPAWIQGFLIAGLCGGGHLPSARYSFGRAIMQKIRIKIQWYLLSIGLNRFAVEH